MKHFIYKDNSKAKYVSFQLLESNKLIRKLHFASPIIFECQANSIVDADDQFKKEKGKIGPNIGTSVI